MFFSAYSFFEEFKGVAYVEQFFFMMCDKFLFCLIL